MDVARRFRPFQKVLVPLDGSVSGLWILTRLENLLRLPGSRVTLLQVEKLSRWLGREAHARSRPLQKNAREFLAGVQERLVHRGIHSDAVVRSGDPAREIVRESLRGGHDVIAMSTAGVSRIGRVVNRSVAHDVIRLSSIPVIVCRRLSRLDESFFSVERSEPAEFRRVLVPLDQSRAAEDVLPYATELARAFGSELMLVTVLDPADRAYDRQSALAYLERWARVTRESGVACSFEVRTGDPAAILASMLESTSDAMAITTRGRSSLTAAVFGSVTLSVLHRVEGPILVIRGANLAAAPPGRDHVRLLSPGPRSNP